MSLHFLFGCMPGFHRSCSPLHSLFNPNIQPKIRRISMSNNFEHLLKANSLLRLWWSLLQIVLLFERLFLAYVVSFVVFILF